MSRRAVLGERWVFVSAAYTPGVVCLTVLPWLSAALILSPTPAAAFSRRGLPAVELRRGQRRKPTPVTPSADLVRGEHVRGGTAAPIGMVRTRTAARL